MPRERKNAQYIGDFWESSFVKNSQLTVSQYPEIERFKDPTKKDEATMANSEPKHPLEAERGAFEKHAKLSRPAHVGKSGVKLYGYVAGPFFNPEQVAMIELLKETLLQCDCTVFSPKDECMFVQGETTPKQILDMNVGALDLVDFIVVCTDWRDMGTLFEAGYAYAKKLPIIYAWFTGTKEMKFNLMLGASGSVARHRGELALHIERFKRGDFTIQSIEGQLYE